jgi:hypothetical protein
MVYLGHSAFRHAVHAAKITSIRHGKSKIVDFSSIRVNKGGHKKPFSNNLEQERRTVHIFIRGVNSSIFKCYLKRNNFCGTKRAHTTSLE